MKLTTAEQLAADEFTRANEACDAANDTLEETFMPLVKALCVRKDYQGAGEYIKLMPESVAKMYAADYLRYARGDYDEYK